jgi:osmoprotectant transport system ATP-binding protein
MIRFENVTKKYGDFTAVDNLNLEINAGEIVVLIGPSGCGKTTTLRMINRLIEHTEGTIYIKDRDITTVNPVELRRSIGYVIQQVGLFPHMSIAQNIGLVPYLKGWPEEKRIKRVEELLEMVGMSPAEFYDRYPHELSGGQQQRIGVARALAADPEIILMDEPFGALDPITREVLQDELMKLQDEVKKTIVFVTHDMDEALKLADRIAIMKDGKVLQYDTPEELIRNPAHGFVEEFIGRERLLKRPELIKAGDIMIKDPVTISPERRSLQALERMRTQKVDSLLVVDKDNKLIGLVTIKYLHQHLGEGEKVADLMLANPTSIKEDVDVSTVLALMAREQVGYLPVVDEDNRLKGLITRASLVNVLGERY